MAKKRTESYQIKRSEEFKEFIRSKMQIDSTTEDIICKGVSVGVYIVIKFKGKSYGMSYSHIVWLLKNGEWPKENYDIDHIDKNPFNNKSYNLRELTQNENRKTVKPTKYGYGISISRNRFNGKYYVNRNLPREQSAHGERYRVSVCRGDTLEEVEAKIKEYIETIENPTDLDDFLE